MRQNLTLSLEKELLQKIRVIAAKRSTSISGIVGDELRRIVEDSEKYEQAKRRALADLEAGFHLGGKRLNREELHDRQALR